MRVFISWSGEPSRSVAQALREWLPMVVQHVEPWMSEEDIESGGRWNDAIAAELEGAEYGLICLTSTNLERPWLIFEAGALAKRFDVARVVPLLIDLKPADVTMPLASFQGRALSEEGMRRLVKDLNEEREQPLPAQQIDQLFTGMWPMLETQVVAVKTRRVTEEGGKTPRDASDLMDELVVTVRRIERRMDSQSLMTGYGMIEEPNMQNFSDSLTKAVGQLIGCIEAGNDASHKQEELERLTGLFEALMREAHEIGLPMSPSMYAAVRDRWRQRYDSQFRASPPDEPRLT
jgi:hypothetical protein